MKCVIIIQNIHMQIVGVAGPFDNSRHAELYAQHEIPEDFIYTVWTLFETVTTEA